MFRQIKMGYGIHSECMRLLEQLANLVPCILAWLLFKNAMLT